LWKSENSQPEHQTEATVAAGTSTSEIPDNDTIIRLADLLDLSDVSISSDDNSDDDDTPYPHDVVIGRCCVD